MKNKLFILFCLFCLTSFIIPSIENKAKAQVSFVPTVSNPSDSLINNGADTLSYRLTKGYSRLCITFAVIRGSGTIAGTSILEYSVNGTDWFSDAGDTLTLSNSARYSGRWNKTVSARYWRIRTGGATTLRAKCEAKLQTD